MTQREQLLTNALDAAKTAIAKIESQYDFRFLNSMRVLDATDALKKALSALDALKDNKTWCAMCGKMTDHGSGACPELHLTKPDTITLQSDLFEALHFCYEANLHEGTHRLTEDMQNKLNALLKNSTKEPKNITLPRSLVEGNDGVMEALDAGLKCAEFARELERANDRMRYALAMIGRHGPIMGSTGAYRQGQLDILKAVSTIAEHALAQDSEL